MAEMAVYDEEAKVPESKESRTEVSMTAVTALPPEYSATNPAIQPKHIFAGVSTMEFTGTQAKSGLNLKKRGKKTTQPPSSGGFRMINSPSSGKLSPTQIASLVGSPTGPNSLDAILRRSVMNSPRKYLPRLNHTVVSQPRPDSDSKTFAASSTGKSASCSNILGVQGNSLQKVENIRRTRRHSSSVFSMPPRAYAEDLRTSPTNELWPRLELHFCQLQFCRTLISYSANIQVDSGLESSIEHIVNATTKMLGVENIRIYLYQDEESLEQIGHSEPKQFDSLLEKLAASAISNLDEWTFFEDTHPDLVQQSEVHNITKASHRVHNGLAGPIVNCAGKPLGVIVAVNKRKQDTSYDRRKQHQQSKKAKRGGTMSHEVENCTTIEFTPDDAALLEIAARVASVWIQNNYMFRRMKASSDKTAWMLEMLQTFSSELEVNKAVERIIDCSYNILNCDRCSIYIVDKEAQELVCHVSQDVKGIRIPLSTGIAGHVASTGETLNVPDVSKDPRFNPQVDFESGYHTKCILCQPIHNIEGEIVAVVQAVNKRPDSEPDCAKTSTTDDQALEQEPDTNSDVMESPINSSTIKQEHVEDSASSSMDQFTEEDATLLNAIANQAGIALTNAHLYRIEKVARRKSEALVETSKLVSSELRLIPLIQLMVAEARNLIEADRCVVLLLDQKTNELWAVHALGLADQLRFPSDVGIAGHVIQTGKPIRIEDAYSSPHFNKDFDVKTGYKTKTVLAVPIKSNNGTIIGVVQMINKMSEKRFSASDVDFLEAFSSMAAVAITNAKLYEDLSHYGSYMGSVLQSLSSYVFTLNKCGQLVICNREIREVLNVSESVMRSQSYNEWIGRMCDNIQLSNDIDLVFKTGNPVLVTDYALTILMEECTASDTSKANVKQTRELMVNYTVLPLDPGMEDSGNKNTSFKQCSGKSRAAKASAPRKSLQMQFSEGIQSTVGLDIGKECMNIRKSEPTKECSEVQGIIVIIEPVDERDKMQYKLMRYKNRLSFVQSQLSILKQKITVARTTPIQSIRARMDELVRIAVQLSSCQLKRTASYDGNLLHPTDECSAVDIPLDAQDTVGRKSNVDRRRSSVKTDGDLKKFAHMLIEVKQLLHSPDLFRPAFQDDESSMSAAEFTEMQVDDFAVLTSEKATPISISGEKMKPPLFKRYSVLNVNATEESSIKQNSKFLRLTFGTDNESSSGRETLKHGDSVANMIADIDHDENYALRSWDLDLLQYNAQQLIPLVLDMFTDLAVSNKAIRTISSQTLTFIAMQLFQNFDLNADLMNHWLQAVRTNYKENPFHNFHHAVTVAHVSFLLVREPIMLERLHMADVLALMIAALCHDLDHPGVNNVFEVNSESPLAVLYNDKSVLENHHASLAFTLLKSDDTAILRHLPVTDQRYLRKMIVTSILHTDMAIHFELMSKFDTWISQDFRYSDNTDMSSACREDAEVRMLVTSTMLHCADLSNPVRKFPVCRKWALLLNDEFTKQVEAEKRLGLPLSEMMLHGDDMRVVAQREVNFLDYVVLPCWSTFQNFLPSTSAQVEQAQLNRASWLAEKEGLEESED